MPRFDYKVVPAPKKARRVKGVKTTEGRFAHALAEIMNEMGADGYEYVRTDALPCEERSGFGGRKEITQHMLVFRKVIETGLAAETITSAHLTLAERTPEPAPVYRAPEPAYEPAPHLAPEPDPMPEPVQTFQRLRATDYDHPGDEHPAQATVRTAFRAAPSPVAAPVPAPEREPAPAASPPSFRSVKAEPQEPVFSRSLEGRAPRLGGAYSDER